MLCGSAFFAECTAELTLLCSDILTFSIAQKNYKITNYIITLSYETKCIIMLIM